MTASMTLGLTSIAATPAERFHLCLILLQTDETGRMVLQLKHGHEGRSLRALMRNLGLEPIRQVLARHGAVATKLAAASEREHLRHFSLLPEAVAFFRERVADLPRTVAQECVVGELLDSLHGIGPGIYGRDVGSPPPSEPDAVVTVPRYEASEEDWTPPQSPPQLVPDAVISAAAVQAAIDDFEVVLEQLPQEERVVVVPRLEGFLDKLTGLLMAGP